LLLGAFLLVTVAVGIATVSPAIALALVIVVVVGYLVGLHRQEQRRKDAD
jgi:hypothetical protein